MPFYLLDREPLATGLRRIAHEQIAIALRDLGDDDLSLQYRLHSLRSRTKKMRGLLRLPGPLMGEAFEIEDGRFHAAADALAGHRDQGVCERTIASLQETNDGAATQDREVPAAAIEQARGIMAACDAAVDGWPLPVEGFADLAPGFARTYRTCLEAWETVLRAPNDADFHRLRKWTKYHWYQVRILERLSKSELRGRREQFHKLERTLGEAHDLVLLQSRIEGEDFRVTRLLKRASARKQALYKQAVKLGRQAFGKSADELVADLARYWADRHM